MADNQDLAVEQENQDQQQIVDWREKLDPSIKEHPSLKNFKSEGDLAKSWVEAQKLIGRDKIPVPGEKATKADWDIVFDRLGRPKTVDGYVIPEIKYPEGYPVPSKEFNEQLKAKAFQLGLLPAQINELYNWFMGNEIDEYNKFVNGRQESRVAGENALRKEWGAAFEQNFQIAEQAVNKFGTDQFIEKLKASGLNNDPDMVKFIADMAKNFSEDKITGKSAGLTLSPDEAKAEIAKIQAEAMKDKNHVMNNKHHPEYEYFLNKWKSLHEMAYG